MIDEYQKNEKIFILKIQFETFSFATLFSHAYFIWNQNKLSNLNGEIGWGGNYGGQVNGQGWGELKINCREFKCMN